jgi:peptidoglycan hydrolase-like protein with peptidoglycan-binding domain
MSLVAHSPLRTCFFCSKEATEKPIGGSVGKGGSNKKADVRIVQAFLNSTPPAEGGPAFLLAEDGIIGPKTQAAIDKFQAKVLRQPDGRIDPHGPTIKALTKLICDSDSVPAGRLGLDGRPGQAAGSPSKPPTPGQTGPQMVAEGKQILKDLERTLMSLRFKLLHQTPTTMAC